MAAHRVDSQKSKEKALNAWVATHSDYEGIQKFIKAPSLGKKQKPQEITPEESRKATIGLINALNMGTNV